VQHGLAGGRLLDDEVLMAQPLRERVLARCRRPGEEHARHALGRMLDARLAAECGDRRIAGIVSGEDQIQVVGHVIGRGVALFAVMRAGFADHRRQTLVEVGLQAARIR
jgi:hypothetical protein